MARIYLVRHGEAAAHWTAAEDAELSVRGAEQAAAVARMLASRGAQATIFSSPLRRARATALPLEALWQTAALIEHAITEIPTQGVALADRQTWLMSLAQGDWQSADPASQKWRRGVIDFVASLQADAVIFTHFVAINALVGAALGREDVYLFKPANGSVTVVENSGGRLHLIEQGAEVERSPQSPGG